MNRAGARRALARRTRSSGHFKATSSVAVAATLLVIFTAAAAAAQAAPNKNLHLADVRNMPFCEIEVASGWPPFIRVNFNNTTGASDCPPAAFDAIDPKELARKLRADRVVLNPRRHWTMDQVWVFGIGATKDFDGVKATWMGSAPLREFRNAGKAFAPLTTNRASKYLYDRGKPVYLLTPPGARGVYVMQSYTDHIEKGLTIDKLPQLGQTLKLPPGWSFSDKVLDRDLVVAPRPPRYTAHTVVDNLGNVYAGCGFDRACNFVP